MDRHDERDLRAERRAHRRAVQHVDAVALRGARERQAVPDRVAHAPSSPARRRPSVAAHLELGLRFEPVEEVRQIAGRPGLRQGERRGVETHAQHGTKCLRALFRNPCRWASPQARHVKRRACSSPRGTRLVALGERAFDALRDRLRAHRVRRARPRRRTPRRATAWAEATTGVPQAIASTTGIPKPSKSDGYAKTLRRRGRARAARSSGTNPSAVTPSPASSCSAQCTGEPATTSSSSGRCERTSSMRRDERGQVLARLERRHRRARTAPPRSALGPLGRVALVDPRVGDRIRSRGTPSVSATSSAVNSEIAKIRSHVVAAFAYFAAVHPARQRRDPLRDSAAGRGRGRSSSAIRLAARGYIQSEKWKTSSCPASRSTLGKPSRLHAVLQVCDDGPTTTIFCSTERPASASLMRGAPRGPTTANATSSCCPAAASAVPRSMPSR